MISNLGGTDRWLNISFLISLILTLSAFVYKAWLNATFPADNTLWVPSRYTRETIEYLWMVPGLIIGRWPIYWLLIKDWKRKDAFFDILAMTLYSTVIVGCGLGLIIDLGSLIDNVYPGQLGNFMTSQGGKEYYDQYWYNWTTQNFSGGMILLFVVVLEVFILGVRWRRTGQTGISYPIVRAGAISIVGGVIGFLVFAAAAYFIWVLTG